MEYVSLSSFIIEDQFDHSKDKIYVLKKDLVFDVEKCEDPDGIWFVLTNDEYNLYGTGPTIGSAMLNAELDLSTSYEVYTSTPDEKLTKRALRLKNKFLNMIS